MSGDRDSGKLTLRDLWEREADSPDQGGSNDREFTLNWARTLVAQVTVIGSLLGIRLPRPIVNEGPIIVWQLPKAHITVKPERRAPSETPKDMPYSSEDHDDFILSGSICSTPDSSGEAQKEYLSFTTRGKVNENFLFASVVNWFPLKNSFPLPPSRTVRPQTGREDMVETTATGRKAVWIRPRGLPEVHEMVREHLLRLKKEGKSVHGVRMLPKEMADLRQGWDGTDAPPPSPDAVEVARYIESNLYMAAFSLGGEFSPRTYAFVDEPEAGGGKQTFIEVCVDTGTTFVDLEIRSEPEQNLFSFLLDYDPTDTSPKKWYLKGECTVVRVSGKSSYQVLRELFQ